MFNCFKVVVKRTAGKQTLYSKNLRNFSDILTKKEFDPTTISREDLHDSLERFRPIFTPEGFAFAKEVIQLFDKHFPNSFSTSIADELGTNKELVSTDLEPKRKFIASRALAVQCLHNFHKLKHHSITEVNEILRELDYFMEDNESIKSLVSEVSDVLGCKILACITHFSQEDGEGNTTEKDHKKDVVNQLTVLLNKVVTEVKDDKSPDSTIWECIDDDDDNDDDDEEDLDDDWKHEVFKYEDVEDLLTGLFNMLQDRVKAVDATPESILPVATIALHAASYRYGKIGSDAVWIANALVRHRDYSEVSTALLGCFAEVHWDGAISADTKRILVAVIEHLLSVHPTEEVVIAAAKAVVRSIRDVDKSGEVGLRFITAYKNALARGGPEMDTENINDAMWRVLTFLTRGGDKGRLSFLMSTTEKEFEKALGKSIESLQQ